jgi:hypothetical protein
MRSWADKVVMRSSSRDGTEQVARGAQIERFKALGKTF